MSILKQVQTGIIEKPELILLYAPDGVGKSTFAADAPGAIFLGPEKGTAFLDVARFPQPETFEEILTALDALLKEEHKYKTLVIDTLDWLEPLVWDYVCRQNKWTSIEDPGYGKGFVKANETWRTSFISKLSQLQESKRMNVILLAHSQIRTFQDPTNASDYDRYQLKLNEKAGALFREFVDCVLFANFEVNTVKENKNDKKSKAFGDGRRVMYTERRPAFDAKNRQGLPFELPLSWDEYVKATKKREPEAPETLVQKITGLLENVKDENLRKTVTERMDAAKTDSLTLGKIHNRLMALVNAA